MSSSTGRLNHYGFHHSLRRLRNDSSTQSYDGYYETTTTQYENENTTTVSPHNGLNGIKEGISNKLSYLSSQSSYFAEIWLAGVVALLILLLLLLFCFVVLKMAVFKKKRKPRRRAIDDQSRIETDVTILEPYEHEEWEE